MLWKDLSKLFIWRNSPTPQNLSGSALRNGLKHLHVIVQDWSAFTRNFTFSYCSKRGHARYWRQIFTYFCNAKVCNTGSFFSINKWHRKYFSLTCLIGFSLSTFSTWIWKYDDVLGIYAKISKILKGSQIFKQHCVYVCMYVCIYIYISGGPLSALTCCVNVRLLSAIKKISPLIYSQSWVGSWVYTTQAIMTFTLIF